EMLTTLSIRERLPQIEVAVADNAVALVLRVLSPPTGEDFAKLHAFEAAHDVRLYLQPAGLDSVHRLPPASEEGNFGTLPASQPAESPLTYALPDFGVTCEFTPTDFIQINGAINQALVGRAIELHAPEPEAPVLDLFCGLGNFTLPLARRAARVV